MFAAHRWLDVRAAWRTEHGACSVCSHAFYPGSEYPGVPLEACGGARPGLQPAPGRVGSEGRGEAERLTSAPTDPRLLWLVARARYRTRTSTIPTARALGMQVKGLEAVLHAREQLSLMQEYVRSCQSMQTM